MPDKDLYPVYGKNPLAGQIYLRLYPNLMKMRRSGGSHAGH
jgi:hypothetical protein